jgi:hypothetical protein
MSKVIIKVNSFMKTKEFTDVCNFIYNQYKERDIVIVPPYCDVYVVDGNPEIKIEKSDSNSESRCCGTCKYKDTCTNESFCFGNDWEAKENG